MLNKILSGAKEIAIGGHVRPDGDCVGSCMDCVSISLRIIQIKK